MARKYQQAVRVTVHVYARADIHTSTAYTRSHWGFITHLLFEENEENDREADDADEEDQQSLEKSLSDF